MGEYLQLVEETLNEWAKKDTSVDKPMADEIENHIKTTHHDKQRQAIHTRLDQIKQGFRVKRDAISGEKQPYDVQKAHKAFRNVVDNAAKDYHKQHGGSSSHGTREQVASALLAHYQGTANVNEEVVHEGSRSQKIGVPGSKKREVHIKMQDARLRRQPQPYAGPEGDDVDKTIRKNVVGKSWKNRIPPREDK